MPVIKIERLKDGTGVRAFPPGSPHYVIEYKDLFIAYMGDTVIHEAHSHLAIELMEKLKADDDLLKKVTEMYFKSENIVQIVKSSIHNNHLSCEIIEANGENGTHLRASGIATTTDKGKVGFNVSISSVLRHLNKKAEDPITEKEFMSSGHGYQTAFIKGYLESRGTI